MNLPNYPHLKIILYFHSLTIRKKGSPIQHMRINSLFCICEPYSQKKEDKPVDLLMFSKQISWKTSKYVENYLMAFIKVSDIITFLSIPNNFHSLNSTPHFFLSYVVIHPFTVHIIIFLLIVLCPIVTKNHFFKCYLISFCWHYGSTWSLGESLK